MGVPLIMTKLWHGLACPVLAQLFDSIMSHGRSGREDMRFIAETCARVPTETFLHCPLLPHRVHMSSQVLI